MLPHLLRRAASSVVYAALIALGVTLTASVVRVLPWLASDQVPLPLTVAFLRVLALSAVEVTLLVAAPLGCALEAVRWVDDGTVRTLRALGVSPVAMASHFAAVAVVVALFAFLTSSAVGTWAGQPGRLSNTLIHDAGRHVCSTHRAAVVPLVNVTWMCVGDRPVLAGPIGRDGNVVGAWRASEGRFTGDLAALSLSDVHAQLARPPLTVRAKVLVVSGLVPWIEPSKSAAMVRGAGGALVILCASFGVVWGIVWRRSLSRAVAMAAAIVGVLPFLVGWSAVEGLPPLARLGLIALLALALPPALVLVSSRARLLRAVPGGTNL